MTRTTKRPPATSRRPPTRAAAAPLPGNANHVPVLLEAVLAKSVDLLDGIHLGLHGPVGRLRDVLEIKQGTADESPIAVVVLGLCTARISAQQVGGAGEIHYRLHTARLVQIALGTSSSLTWPDTPSSFDPLPSLCRRARCRS